MVMVVGPLMGVKDPGKVGNRRVAKSRIVLILIILTRNKLFLEKNRVLKTATKRRETKGCPPTQCTYIPSQLTSLTSLVNFAVQQHKVD